MEHRSRSPAKVGSVEFGLRPGGREGAALPVVAGSPLRVTNIELKAGEVVKVMGAHAGDTVRWQIGPPVSGPTGAQVTHVMAKPGSQGLRTDLVIATDRRTYPMELLSTAETWMPCVASPWRFTN